MCPGERELGPAPLPQRKLPLSKSGCPDDEREPHETDVRRGTQRSCDVLCSTTICQRHGEVAACRGCDHSLPTAASYVMRTAIRQTGLRFRTFSAPSERR